jgi:Holliday junction resolvasome RuvABC endonuclease subunit
MGKSLNPLYMKEYYQKNKEKLNQQSREYYQLHKEKLLITQKTSARKRLYNISDSQVQEVLKEQNNCCAICKQTFVKEPHIDHDHTTMNFRGLLCLSCNTTLGKYEKYKEAFDRYFFLAYINEN